jgi:hypothetical protein
MPTRNLVPGSLYTVLGAIMVGLAGVFSFRSRGASEPPPPGSTAPPPPREELRP